MTITKMIKKFIKLNWFEWSNDERSKCMNGTQYSNG